MTRTRSSDRAVADSAPKAAAPGAAVGRPGTWHICAGSARGAAHRAAGLPNQDSVTRCPAAASGAAVIAAVADGHGHRRHFRSADGSAYAAAVGCQVGSRMAAGLAGQTARVGAAAAVRSHVADLVLEWRAAVAGHLAAHPYTAEEQSALDSDGDGPDVPYGSTLLLAVAAPRWLACVQIGDGDFLAVHPGGRSAVPLPGDDRLDGLRTTSLCQADAAEAFRIGVQDLDEVPLLALLLATDGFGNAQAADPWQPGVGQDLAKLMAEYDHHWFDEQVPQWAEHCASAQGSGDDTTIVLLLHPGAMACGRRPMARRRGRAAGAAADDHPAQEGA
jgi:hypothetical protein